MTYYKAVTIIYTDLRIDKLINGTECHRKHRHIYEILIGDGSNGISVVLRRELRRNLAN